MEQSSMTAEQQACEQHFIANAVQQPDGRFVVRLPTKLDPKQLGSSRLSAERRLDARERRLERHPDLKGPPWLSHEPSSWPTSEVNSPMHNFELKKVHVARLHSPEDFTQRFYKLTRLTRVIAYCRRFIQNCRHPKVNRQINTLSPQELNYALTCCVKVVQQISYVQEFKELTETQEVAVNSSLKTLHPFIDKEGLLRVGRRLRHSTLPYRTIHQMILPAIIIFQN
jgi:hypothetical protein